MKNREEVARFVESQLESEVPKTREKKGKHHYGFQELRELMDFIYGGEPENAEQNIKNDDEWRKPN